MADQDQELRAAVADLLARGAPQEMIDAVIDRWDRQVPAGPQTQDTRAGGGIGRPHANVADDPERQPASTSQFRDPDAPPPADFGYSVLRDIAARMVSNVNKSVAPGGQQQLWDEAAEAGKHPIDNLRSLLFDTPRSIASAVGTNDPDVASQGIRDAAGYLPLAMRGATPEAIRNVPEDLRTVRAAAQRGGQAVRRGVQMTAEGSVRAAKTPVGRAAIGGGIAAVLSGGNPVVTATGALGGGFGGMIADRMAGSGGKGGSGSGLTFDQQTQLEAQKHANRVDLLKQRQAAAAARGPSKPSQPAPAPAPAPPPFIDPNYRGGAGDPEAAGSQPYQAPPGPPTQAYRSQPAQAPPAAPPAAPPGAQAPAPAPAPAPAAAAPSEPAAAPQAAPVPRPTRDVAASVVQAAEPAPVEAELSPHEAFKRRRAQELHDQVMRDERNPYRGADENPPGAELPGRLLPEKKPAQVQDRINELLDKQDKLRKKGKDLTPAERDDLDLHRRRQRQDHHVWEAWLASQKTKP